MPLEIVRGKCSPGHQRPGARGSHAAQGHEVDQPIRAVLVAQTFCCTANTASVWLKQRTAERRHSHLDGVTMIQPVFGRHQVPYSRRDSSRRSCSEASVPSTADRVVGVWNKQTEDPGQFSAYLARVEGTQTQAHARSIIPEYTPEISHSREGAQADTLPKLTYFIVAL